MDNLLVSLIGGAGANGLLLGAIYVYFRYGSGYYGRGATSNQLPASHWDRRLDTLERAHTDTQRILDRQTEILDQIRESNVRLVTLAEVAARRGL